MSISSQQARQIIGNIRFKAQERFSRLFAHVIWDDPDYPHYVNLPMCWDYGDDPVKSRSLLNFAFNILIDIFGIMSSAASTARDAIQPKTPRHPSNEDQDGFDLN